ncbi:hypothetical protein Dda_7205 [Drechslerella dactyloides]|uniref:Nucleoside phosphorylase domain-containing protein n=1 Tax=Drechslerella dactyloides TaxID=74499 RepID=A0AAD6ITD3_DREDA|nr:hypothetical protein Dda_7205 [Drechslerella dactyloides]
MSLRTLTHGDYTVGWICALDTEMVAATAMLDNVHTTLPAALSDDNSYKLGSIGHHNVVVACLPSDNYGTISAARVVAGLRSTFPHIRFGLLVGIGGGVPSADHDVRLGDIIVSTPTATIGGVFQYDSGKSCGDFIRTGSLNKPPFALLTALQNLKSQYSSRGSGIPAIVNEMISTNPRLQQFGYPESDQDRLFAADYDHPSNSRNCNNCDEDKIIARAPRLAAEPMIHFGLVASGNAVIRNGQIRDQLARAENIRALCFEMEAAGVMDSLPCLVIRGVCDYADSHKNDQWQPYAAATAAAYGKELLSMVPPRQSYGVHSVAAEIRQGPPEEPDIETLDAYIPKDREALYGLFRKSISEKPIATVFPGAGSARYCEDFLTPKITAMGRWDTVLWHYVNDSGSLDVQGHDGKTPLHYALGVRHERDNKVRALVEMGADVTVKDPNGQTPIDVAKSEGAPAEAMYIVLLDAWKKSQVKLRRQREETSRNRNTQFPEPIISHLDQSPRSQGPVPTSPQLESEGFTTAQGPSGLDTARAWLEENGIDINAVDFDADKALVQVLLVHGYRQDVIELLLDSGAKATAKTGDNWTALHLAANCGNIEAVQLLLAKGAEVNATDSAGQTALHKASVAFDNAESIMQILMDAGADATARDVNGNTPLHTAECHGHYKRVELLLENMLDAGVES